MASLEKEEKKYKNRHYPPLALKISEGCSYISILKKNLPSLLSLFYVGDVGEPLLPSSCSRYVTLSMPSPWNVFLNSSPREDREDIKMDLGMRHGPRSVSHFCLFLCLPSSRQCSRSTAHCGPFQAFLPPSAEWDSHASQEVLIRLWQWYILLFCRLRGGKNSSGCTLLGNGPVSQYRLLQRVFQWKLAGSREGLAAFKGPLWGKETWLLYDTWMEMEAYL